MKDLPQATAAGLLRPQRYAFGRDSRILELLCHPVCPELRGILHLGDERRRRRLLHRISDDSSGKCTSPHSPPAPSPTQKRPRP
jgi:hypothetical protein